jgi:hypothetical protein
LTRARLVAKALHQLADAAAMVTAMAVVAAVAFHLI